jgi:hypothetical protein
MKNAARGVIAMNREGRHPEPEYDGNSSHRRAEALQRRTILISILVHLSFIGYLQWPSSHSHHPPSPRPKLDVVFLATFVPERSPEAAAKEPLKLEQPVAPSVIPEIVAEEAVPHSTVSPDESKVDVTKALASLKYDDRNHELPTILRRYRGYIGFGYRTELDDYARRVFDATGKETPLPEGIVSLDKFGCAIRIEEGGYEIVNDLRRRNHLEAYAAYALFPQVFAEELKHTLKKAALDRYGGGKFASATVILSAAVENGLEAGELVMVKGSR